MPDRKPIGNQHALSETHRIPICLIRDQYASSENNMPNRIPKCLIGDPAERDMPHQRPIGDQHSSLETHEKRVHKNINMIRYLSETHWRPIRDPSETEMSDRRPIHD